MVENPGTSPMFLRERDALLNLCPTFVIPLLEYASVVWDGCSSTEIENIEIVELNATRIVTGFLDF